MNKEDVIKQNAIIAEYMGYQYFPFDHTQKQWVNDKVGGIPLNQNNGWRKPTNGHLKIQGWYLCRTAKDMRYHCSWDWLMPVVEKIMKKELPENDNTYLRTFGMINVLTGGTMARFNYHQLFEAPTLLEATYLAVCDYLNPE